MLSTYRKTRILGRNSTNVTGIIFLKMVYIAQKICLTVKIGLTLYTFLKKQSIILKIGSLVETWRISSEPIQNQEMVQMFMVVTYVDL